MDTKLQELIDSASPVELEEAATYIQFRIAKTTKGDVSHKEFAFWQSVCAAANNGSCAPDQIGLLAFLGGTARTKTGFGVKAYRTAMQVVEKYIDQGVSRATLSKIERSQLTTLLLSAVATRAQHVGAPITPTTILQHATASLGAAVEWQYPGYYRSGLLHVLVKNKQGARVC